MYHVHTTEAYILSRVSHGETNALIVLFTRDFGRIQAVAQGVRKTTSKLNPFLQEYAFVRISLVRGKEWWRIVTVEGIGSLYVSARGDERRLRIITHIIKLLNRLVQGEECNEVLFDSLSEVFQKLSDRTLTKEEVVSLEIVGVLRLLYHLGYVSRSDETVALSEEVITKDILTRVHTLRKSYISSINASLKITHL
ncbi:MAG: DNA repair protein RecO [Candidatus Paceibacterota bacterium]